MKQHLKACELDLEPKYILSLQFYRDEDGTLCLHQMTGEGDLSDTMSMYALGIQLKANDLLDGYDKNGLKAFCKAFLDDSTPPAKAEVQEMKEGK